MKKKTTGDLLKALTEKTNIRHFLKENADEFENTTLTEELNRLLEKSTHTKAEIIRLSNLDKTYAYQIFDGTRPHPSRDKLLALCLSMGATQDETSRILRLGQWEALYPRNVRDAIIIHAIDHHQTLMELNQTLHQMDMNIVK